MTKTTIRWECYQIVLESRSRVLVRVAWQDFPSDKGMVLRVNPEGSSSCAGAFLIAGDSGIRLPLLAEEFFLIPPQALGANLFLVFDEEDSKGEVLLELEGLPKDVSDTHHLSLRLDEAWQAVPDDIQGPLRSLKRLQESGGSGQERGEYRRACLQFLAQYGQDEARDLLQQLQEPVTMVGLERDMQPLAFSVTIALLAESAEQGDVESVGKALEELPIAIQLNPDVRGLMERAREVSRDPEAADQESLANANSAIAGQRFRRAIHILERIAPERSLYGAAQTGKAEAMIGLAWQAIEEGDEAGARAFLTDGLVLEKLGREHEGRLRALEALSDMVTK